MISRRVFLSGVAAGAIVPAAACKHNPAPTVDSGADRSLPLPEVLSRPGSQAKVRLPDLADPILVWRTEIGFGGVALRCTHCGGEVQYMPQRQNLECTSQQCLYRLDGSVLDGPPRKALRAYLVDLQGERLRILG